MFKIWLQPLQFMTQHQNHDIYIYMYHMQIRCIYVFYLYIHLCVIVSILCSVYIHTLKYLPEDTPNK